MVKEWLEMLKNCLDELYADGMNEGRQLFPHHPKAQEVWAKLCSHRGGITEVIETLGLQKAYSRYKCDLDTAWDTASTEIINLKIEGFVRYCKEQVRENFFMFK